MFLEDLIGPEHASAMARVRAASTTPLAIGETISSADLKLSSSEPSVHTVQVDLTDLGQVYGVAAGVDAIVHLAAIPSPGRHPPEVVFSFWRAQSIHCSNGFVSSG